VRGARAAVAFALAASAIALPSLPARAIPPPDPPRGIASSSPTPLAPGARTLPFGSTVFFVLDDKIDSGSIKAGTVIHMHLRDPLVVDGTTVAAANAPASLAIVSTQPAHSGDVDGAVQIHLEPLRLTNDVALPMRAYHEYLNVERTGGNVATRDTTDTIADIFIPGHAIYHAFRKGRQLVLPVGSVLRAQTAATIEVPGPGSIVLSTPQPFVSTYDAPHAVLTPPPFYTPAPARPRPLPRGKPTLPPTPPPTPTPTAT